MPYRRVNHGALRTTTVTITLPLAWLFTVCQLERIPANVPDKDELAGTAGLAERLLTSGSLDAAGANADTQDLLGRLGVVREQRVTTPDGHVWYVRRRWAKRQLPWKRRPDHELSPAERDAVPVLPDTDDLIGLWAGLITIDPELGLLVPLGLLVLVALAIVAVAGAVLYSGVPFLAANAVLIGLALAVTAVVVLFDRFTRPWFIEAESARLFHPPRRIWRIHGWWRSRRAFHAVVAAITEGRIDSEHGVIVFSDRSKAP